MLPTLLHSSLGLSAVLLCGMPIVASAAPPKKSNADVVIHAVEAPETQLMGFFAYEIRKMPLSDGEAVSEQGAETGWIAFTTRFENSNDGTFVNMYQLKGLSVATHQSIPFEVGLTLEPRKHHPNAFNVELSGLAANGTLVGVAVVESPTEVTLKLHGNEPEATVIKLTRVSGRQLTETGPRSATRAVEKKSNGGTFDATPFYPEGK
ncbi:hypothetical protein [Thalassoroseus pseudoceratinae]|uniref:hypothetical protein n=1 Tax=Thalassoroseus pseudoceratinae TaxID=2713176 RepID=UPI001421B286|nr:hypothetical protein [Thalassoroseus pseudoceratinae]